MYEMNYICDEKNFSWYFFSFLRTTPIAASTKEMEFSDIACIEIVCVELWNSQIEHSNGKFPRPKIQKLASSCCCNAFEFDAKFIYENCCDAFPMCVSWTLKDSTWFVINSSYIEFILPKILLLNFLGRNFRCYMFMLRNNLWDNLIGNLNVHSQAKLVCMLRGWEIYMWENLN